jgi:YbbR domain-containing protein
MTRALRLKAWLFANWPIKLTALVLATVLWAVVAAQVEPITRAVPVTLEITPPQGRQLTSEVPPVQVIYRGIQRELDKLYETMPIIQKSMPDSFTGSTYTLDLTPSDVITREDANVSALEVLPRTVSVSLDDVLQRAVPVALRVTVRPDSGFDRFDSLRVAPTSVTVRGPEPRVSQIQFVNTIRIDTSRVQSRITLTVPLDTAGLGVGVRVEPATVQVSANVVAVSERFLQGVAVTVPNNWVSNPSAVIVRVRGPATRVVRLTRDSVQVYARPNETDPNAHIPVVVSAPQGIEAFAVPDSVSVTRSSSG